MTSTELRDLIKALTPGIPVTINEQFMLNVQADQYEENQLFIYVEEMCTSQVRIVQWKKQRITRHDVYFCQLHHYDSTAEQRQAIREAEIAPVVAIVEEALAKDYQVAYFKEDYWPRGFDANEVLIHIQFDIAEDIC